MDIKMKLIIFIVNLNYFVKCIVQDSNEMYIEENNDYRNIVLVGFFGAHFRGVATECGEINSESGIYLIEAMRYAINNINKDVTLHGFKIGYRIYDTCKSATRLRRQLPSIVQCRHCVGVVGPPTSDEAMLASMLLGTYGISQISYSASSVDLLDKVKYDSFFRTIPADDIQARVLLHILKQYNWKYISTVNSYGNYGQRGMDRLISMLSKEGICISKRILLPKSPTEIDFETVIEELNWDTNARTVVLFTNSKDTITLLKSAAKMKSKFQWLSSSAWKANMETVKGAEEAAKGAILLAYDGTNNERFMEYFKNLILNNNSYRWFREFWEKQFSCTIGITENSTKKICSGNERLSESNFYAKFEAAGAVIDAVNVYARAARCIMETYESAFCGNSTCLMQGQIKYPRMFAIFIKIYLIYSYPNCTDLFNNNLKFNTNNSYYRDIAILNFDGTTYKKVGVWKLNSASQQGTLNISDESIVWYHGLTGPPESICSRPCKFGEQEIQSKLIECCFTCKACGKAEILRKNRCIACQKFSIPNQNKTDCRKLGKMRIEVTHPWSIIVIVLSTLGFILNTIVLALFIKHRDSKIVKASSRELSFFILAGLYLCFISPCVYLLEPTVVRCGLRRFIFGISLIACYTPLVLKTNRIYRIFKAAHVMVSMPQFVSTSSQITICFALIAIQMLLWITWVAVQPPIVTELVYSNNVVNSCSASIFTVIINIIPCFTLMAMSTVYAFKSRKFPKNYNEASSIGITMYISFLLWTIFIPLLFFVHHKSHGPFVEIFVIANFNNLIGLVTLIGLFGPKVRRLFINEDASNVRRFFYTAKRDRPGCNTEIPDRRCHLGKKMGSYERKRYAEEESIQIRLRVSTKTTIKTDLLRQRSTTF